MAGKHVPTIVLEERERELLNAVREADMPAAELFGDASTLAADDVLELATTAETVRTSEGGGPRHAVKDAGGTLLVMGIVSTALLALRSGWSADIYFAHLVLAVGVGVFGAFIDAGGLGYLIDTGQKLARDQVTLVGAFLVASLALTVDWLSAVAQRVLRPRGI